jgi:UDP-glucuronate 4-epimerase
VGVDNFDPFYDRALKQANLDRLSGDGFEFHESDIRDESLAAVLTRTRPDAMFHLAALAGVRPSIEDPARYASVNVNGLVNVLESARAAECTRIVFASSSSVYGNNEKVPFAETDSVDHPISPYAATKRAGELICHAYSHLYGLTIAAPRYFTVFGPAQRPDLAIARFMRLIADGDEVPKFGDGTTSRDYTYIDDIIAGTMAAEQWTADRSTPECRIFNLGHSEPVELNEMIDTIARVVGRPARIKQLPMQPGDVNRTYADVARSRAELGYEPTVPFEDGVRRQWEAASHVV